MKTFGGLSGKMVFLFLSVMLLGSCSSGGGGGAVAQVPDTTFYVDAVSGDDANAGTSGAPFKTITHALSVATGTYKTVKVRPGTYDAALGETFPLTLQAGQTLIGDEANKGNGTTATFINGQGLVSATSYSATIVGAEGAKVSGFKLDHPYVFLGFGVYLSGVTMTVSNNTFASTMYGGVRLAAGFGNPVIESNEFGSKYYGVYSGSSGTATIQDNTFISTMDPGSLAIDTSSGNPLIQRNAFSAANAASVYIQGGSPRIENNTFTGVGSMGAVRPDSTGSPVLRGNTFTLATGPAVEIPTTCSGAPNLGTAASPGNNVFTITSGKDVILVLNTINVQAIGNTWTNAVPTPCTSINVTGAGLIIWGSGGGESCGT